MKTLAEQYKDALSDLPIEVDVVQSDNTLYLRYTIGAYDFKINTRVEDDFDAHVKAILSVIRRDLDENSNPV